MAKTKKKTETSAGIPANVKEISLDELRKLTSEKIKQVRSSAQNTQRFVVYQKYMDAVERALMSGGLVSQSNMYMDNISQVPVPTNARSSEEINIPLFYSDFQYDVGQGPNDDFLFEELYKKDPYIATALEIHSEIPLSKMRLGRPKSKYPEISQMVYDFFLNMLSDMDPTLEVTLQEFLLDWYMKGRAAVWVSWDKKRRIFSSATIITPFVNQARDPFSGKKKVYLRLKENAGGESFMSFLRDNHYPDELIQEISAVISSGDDEIELPTDPYKGSFVYFQARRERFSAPQGISMLSRLKRVARYRSKLMSLQEVIMTRNMFAKHIVVAETDIPEQLEELRADIAISNINPDYEIITNYNVTWNTITAKERLMELTNEWTETEKQYTVGLNLPISLLTGEGRYENERLSVELMNTRYAIVRDIVRDFVENYIFKPTAFANNFYERDNDREFLLEEFWNRDDDPLNFSEVVPDGSLDPVVHDVRQRIRDFREKYGQPHMHDELAAGLKKVGEELEKLQTERREYIKERIEEVLAHIAWVIERVKMKLSLGRLRRRVTELKDLLSASGFPELENWPKVIAAYERAAGENLSKLAEGVLEKSSMVPEQRDGILKFMSYLDSDEDQDEQTQYILKRLGKKIRGLSKYKLLEDPTIIFLYPKVSFKRVSITDPAEAFSQLFNLFTQNGLPLSPLLDLFDFDEGQIEEELKQNFLSPKQAGQQELFSSLFGEVGRKLAENPAVVKQIVKNYGLNRDVEKEILDNEKKSDDKDEGGGGGLF